MVQYVIWIMVWGLCDWYYIKCFPVLMQSTHPVMLLWVRGMFRQSQWIRGFQKKPILVVPSHWQCKAVKSIQIDCSEFTLANTLLPLLNIYLWMVYYLHLWVFMHSITLTLYLFLVSTVFCLVVIVIPLPGESFTLLRLDLPTVAPCFYSTNPTSAGESFKSVYYKHFKRFHFVVV